MGSAQSRLQIGPFRIERELGRGAQGIVYLAQDDRLDRFVAIKTLNPNGIFRNIDHTQLRREAAAVARLKSPNIVPLYDLGEWRGAPYLVFEYVEGETLASRLKNSVSAKRSTPY